MMPYEAMLPNGIAWLGEDRWSLTAELGDISYLIAPQTDQEEILNRWARWLNGFGGGVSIQLTIVNEVLDTDSFGRMARMKLAGDDGDVLREDFNRHIARKLATTRGNVLTRRYLTFTLAGEEDAEVAQDRLLRALVETGNKLRQLGGQGGCSVRRLERAERLALISSLTRRHEPFAWSDDELAGGRTRTKDAVAPWSVEDRGDHLIVTSGARSTYQATVWVRRLPPWLSDRVIASLADIRGDLTISLHLDPFDAADGLDMVHGQIANLEMQYLTEVKKATRQGYSADLIPHTLLNARTEATELRRDLESSNQRIWATVATVGLSSDSKDDLDGLVEQVTTALRSHSCGGELVTSMMLDGYRTGLPLGAKCLPMERTLTTSAVAVMHPFTTQELMEAGGIWYGANARSGNPLLANRTKAIN
ncbi:VirB4-like conjugal transfer ATPase, CD1110 family, partial [Corynebacterium variabile]|uniref:VirB4-like conjugal transfer ATPase, CD1110 family n=1 Tax=Corynebacterium variabile TaxID=1727 RepID=UPI002FE091CC